MKKNKRLTVNHIAFSNLRARKNQYISTVIGILLAMIFSSGAVFFIACSSNSKEELKYRYFGKEDIIIMGSNEFDCEKAVNDHAISKDYATVKVIGFAHMPDGEKTDGFGLGVFDEKAMDIAYPFIDEGRFPVSKGEIAIEPEALMRMGIKAKLGDKLTFSVSVPDGNKGEVREVTKTYTLCGFLLDKRTDIENYYNIRNVFHKFPSAVVSSSEAVEAGGKEYLVSYISYPSHTNAQLYKFQAYLQSLKLFDNKYMKPVEIHEALVSRKTFQMPVNNMYIYVFFMVLLMLGSCFAIVNAWNSNLRSRKKQIGMLRAVGMTKRQVINIYGREAFFITLLCCPVSMLISYLGVKAYAVYMGDYYAFRPAWWALLLSAAVSIICSMGAVFISLAGAASITPMQAIRDSDMGRKFRRKNIKSKKSFSPSVLFAKRNMMFSRVKQISIIFMLIVIAVLPSICFGLMPELSAGYRSFRQHDSAGYDYYLYSDNYPPSGSNYANYPQYTEITESMRNSLYSSPYVKEAYGYKNACVNLLYDEDNAYVDLLAKARNGFYAINDSLHQSVKDKASYLKQTAAFPPKYETHEDWRYFSEKFGYRNIYPTSVETTSPRRLERIQKRNFLSGKIDIDKLNSGEEIIVTAPPRIGKMLQFFDDFFSGAINTPLKGDKSAQPLSSNERLELLEAYDFPYKIGDEIEISMLVCEDKDFTDKDGDAFDSKHIYKEYRKKVKIGAVLTSTAPDGSGYYPEEMRFVTTNQGLASLGYNYKYSDIEVYLKDECNPQTDAKMEELIANTVAGRRIEHYSYFKDYEAHIDFYKKAVIGMAALIILFFFIAASIISNDISSKIRTGRREIGTLRAVGADTNTIAKVYIYQLLTTFGWGCGLGFSMYILGYFGTKIVITRFMNGNFDFPFCIWQSLLISAFLFLICSLNVFFNVKKQIKSSIVENIREL